MPQQYSALKSSKAAQNGETHNVSVTSGSKEAFGRLSHNICGAFELINKVLSENPQVDSAVGSAVAAALENAKEAISSAKGKNDEISSLSLRLSELDSEFRNALRSLMDANGFNGLAKRSYKKQDVKKLISQNLTPEMIALLEEANKTHDQLRNILTERDSALEDLLQGINSLSENELPELVDKLTPLCIPKDDECDYGVLQRSALLVQYGDRDGVRKVVPKEVAAGGGGVDSD